MDVLLFVGGALFWIALVAVPTVFIIKKMKASSVTAKEMTQHAEATLAAFAKQVGAARYEPREDVWGTEYMSGVRYRCHDIDAALTYGFIQGRSKNERVMLPYLVLEPPAGAAWRESPEPAIKQALTAIGHAPRRTERMQRGYTVYLEPPEKRRGGTFVAPLVEGIVEVGTLVQMVDVACQAARGAVGQGRSLAP